MNKDKLKTRLFVHHPEGVGWDFLQDDEGILPPYIIKIIKKKLRKHNYKIEDLSKWLMQIAKT